jgi:hypothetical protein
MEGINKNSVIQSFHHFEKIITQPLIDHFKVNKIEGIQKMETLFKALESFYRLKLNIDPNDLYFD